VGAFALASAGNSLAAYNPSLVISVNPMLGGSGGVSITFRQGAADDATGKVTVYSPPGSSLELGHRAGTQIGGFNGSFMRGTTPEFIAGSVKADNPANHVTSSCAPGIHEAVWILEFVLAGGAIYRWPMYVDRVRTGPEAAFSTARMVICFPSSYVPPPHGSPGGMSLIGIVVSVFGGFRNPDTPGEHPWNALFVPYLRGTAALNPEQTAQSTSYARLPVKLSATAKRQKRGKQTFAIITACMREAGQAIRGIRVNFYRQKRYGDPPEKVGSSRTNARGCVTTRVLITSRVMLVHTLFLVPWARAADGCTPTLAPRCSAPTIGQPGSFVRVLRVRR
jgi:hypothetical protein